jgi:hypothetical protein
MSKQLVEIVSCDVSPCTETGDDVQTITLMIGLTRHEVDACKAHAEPWRAALDRLLPWSHQVTGKPAKPGRQPRTPAGPPRQASRPAPAAVSAAPGAVTAADLPRGQMAGEGKLRAWCRDVAKLENVNVSGPLKPAHRLAFFAAHPGVTPANLAHWEG